MARMTPLLSPPSGRGWLFGAARCMLLLVTVVLTACTSMMPKKYLPYPLSTDAFDDPAKVVIVPLPVIATSPNEGITSGALTAFLLHNRQDEVTTLLAPQVNYNSNFGVTGSLYGAFYPSADRFLEVNFSSSANINYDYEFRIRDRNFLDRNLDANLFVYLFRDGSARFYGFEQSIRQNETNYADGEIGFAVSLGYEFTKNFQVIIGERFRKVSIGPGAFDDIPNIHDRYTQFGVPGIDGFAAHAQKLSLVYSTLDSSSMPTRGLYARASAEVSASILGSSADYRHYDAEVKGFLPLDERRFITVMRLGYNQTLGNSVPFLERSILGGENTLRGYGRNRFIDSSYLLCNIEERVRLFRWEIFNVTADWEVAPFIDLGAVMESLDNLSPRNFEFNPGIGFRAIVRPNIVGRVDVGFGNEGPAVFVGLGYPF